MKQKEITQHPTEELKRLKGEFSFACATASFTIVETDGNKSPNNMELVICAFPSGTHMPGISLPFDISFSFSFLPFPDFDSNRN